MGVLCLPIDCSLALLVAAVMRCDHQSTILLLARGVRISCGRRVDEAQFDLAVLALHVLEHVLNLLQVHDRLLRFDHDLGCECRSSVPAILLYFEISIDMFQREAIEHTLDIRELTLKPLRDKSLRFVAARSTR
jgi:hypothetical protein